MSGQEQLRVFRNQWTMAAKHIALGWSKTLWTHMRIDHMYAYVATWGTLGRFNGSHLEGSHVRLKRMGRNSGGESLLHDKLGLQCVVDNHAATLCNFS